MKTALLASLLLAPLAAAADDEPVKSGPWNKRDIPAGWAVVETEHYQVQSQIGKETALRLGEHLEAMLEVYADFLPTRRKLETFVLKVFSDKAGFCEYSGFKPDTGTVAYYNQADKELVGYDCGYVFGQRTTPPLLHLTDAATARLTANEVARLDELFDLATSAYTFDLARVLSHEGWHQYFHFYTVSWVDMPSWLDEGLGDWFFMAARDGQAGTEHGYRLGDMNWHRLRSVRRALEDGLTVTFERLMDFKQADYYANPGVFYAQGWSMVHFLLKSDDARRRELIPRLLKDFKDTKNFVKSTDKVFKGLDLAELDKEWIGWLLLQPVDDPLLDAARQFGAKVPVPDLKGEARLIKAYAWYLDHPEFPGVAGS
ncbi:MAG: DUF1570 domain-containing protein [Planctomycetes bacterium]|nr:DUF1570 domain-containing protein [Planctomycetota bacterium]